MTVDPQCRFVVYYNIVRPNKGIHYGRNLCHFCSANHGWLRELNAASHALVGRTWQGYQT